jgi:hypothetical protein
MFSIWTKGIGDWRYLIAGEETARLARLKNSKLLEKATA